MGNYAYFQRNTDLWNDWVTTNLTGGSMRMLIGGKSSWDMFDIVELNIEYPGFTAAYDILTTIGCDAHFVTDMLKFCITHADGAKLNTVLAQPGRLDRIKTALTIGLSGLALVPLLEDAASGVSGTELPSDLGFKSEL